MSLKYVFALTLFNIESHIESIVGSEAEKKFERLFVTAPEDVSTTIERVILNIRHLQKLSLTLEKHPNIIIPSPSVTPQKGLKMPLFDVVINDGEGPTFRNIPTTFTYDPIAFFLPYTSNTDPLTDTFNCILDLVRAVAHMHRQNIALGCIHPHCLIRKKIGAGFGIILLPDEHRKPELNSYIPPEGRSEKTFASDVWQVGMTIHALLDLLVQKNEELSSG